MKSQKQRNIRPTRKLLTCALASCLMLGVAPIAFAQSTGATLRGAAVADATITVTNVDTGLTRTAKATNGTYNLATADKTNRTAANVDSAISAFTTILADFGTKSKSLDRQLTFVGKMQDSLETGIGNLVDADLAKESARLTALQTKQQLGVQALSIANASSSILLGLFR